MIREYPREINQNIQLRLAGDLACTHAISALPKMRCDNKEVQDNSTCRGSPSYPVCLCCYPYGRASLLLLESVLQSSILVDHLLLSSVRWGHSDSHIKEKERSYNVSMEPLMALASFPESLRRTPSIGNITYKRIEKMKPEEKVTSKG